VIQTETIIISARNFYMKQWREATINELQIGCVCVPFRLKDGGAREKGEGVPEQLTSQNKQAGGGGGRCQAQSVKSKTRRHEIRLRCWRLVND
jgi:hypothetical protein